MMAIDWKARAETAEAALKAHEWRYDLGPKAVPNGPIEVAFSGGLGMCNVQICERRITYGGLQDGYPIPIEEHEYGYFTEGSKINIARAGWRPYAWRAVPAIPVQVFKVPAPPSELAGGE